MDRVVAAGQSTIGTEVGDSGVLLIRLYVYDSKLNTLIMESLATEPLSADVLRGTLEKDPKITMVGAVHSESSSGLLNPIRSLADVCRERDLLFLVDAVSSLGGVEMQIDAWNIDLCVSASQKCLEGPPGLGLVAVGERAWKRIESYATPGWYLNLHVWREFADKWGSWHPYPITMAVPAVRAFRCGIERVLAEGLSSRFDRHRRSAQRLRSRLGDFGLSPVFTEELATPTVVATYGRPDLSADAMVEQLSTDYGIKIGKGMGAFEGKAFRIGNMGPQAMPDQIEPLGHEVGILHQFRCSELLSHAQAVAGSPP